MGLDYKVVFMAPPDPNRPSSWAVTNLKEQTIIINPLLSRQTQEQTFLHELLHVIFFTMGLDKAIELSEEKEEALVNSIANGLYMIIKSKVLNV